MEAGPAAVHQQRTRHRHELRTLTYVTLDQANGGIVRNLSHDGIAVQAVAAVRPRQQLRVRFELRYPKLRVETRGEVVWSTFSGQCGIRFLDLSPRLVRQIDEWIFGDLLQGLSIPGEHPGSVFADAASSIAGRPMLTPIPSAAAARAAGFSAGRILEDTKEKDDFESEAEESKDGERETDDGLIVSPAQLKVIELRPPPEPLPASAARATATAIPAPVRVELDWLSQPLSGRSLAWTVDTLVVIAAVLLFVFVFLSVTREAPRWPVTMAMAAVIVMGGFYWGFFKLFGGSSLGARLARLAADVEEAEEPAAARFR